MGNPLAFTIQLAIVVTVLINPVLPRSMKPEYPIIDRLCSLYECGVIDCGLCRVYTMDDESVTYWGSSIRQGGCDNLINHDITPDIEKRAIRWIEIMPSQYKRIGRRIDFCEGAIDEGILVKVGSILVLNEIPFNMSYGNMRIYNPDMNFDFISEEHLRRLSNVNVFESEQLLRNISERQSC